MWQLPAQRNVREVGQFVCAPLPRFCPQTSCSLYLRYKLRALPEALLPCPVSYHPAGQKPLVPPEHSDSLPAHPFLSFLPNFRFLFLSVLLYGRCPSAGFLTPGPQCIHRPITDLFPQPRAPLIVKCSMKGQVLPRHCLE